MYDLREPSETDHTTQTSYRKLCLQIRGRKYLLTVAAILVLAKILLATFTPASKEVLFYLRIGSGSGTAELLAASPWGQWYGATLAAWNAFPFEHSPVTDIWRSKTLLLDPSLHLLLLMVRLPLLLADLVVGLTLYGLGRKLWSGAHMPAYATIAWLANPYVTFATEMLGAVDIVPLMALMLGIYFTMTRRELLGSLSLAAGVALKLFPIILLPASLLFARARGARSLRLLGYGLFAIGAAGVYFAWSKNPAFLFSYTPVTQPITEFVLGRQSILHYGTGDFIGLSTLSVVVLYLVLYEFHQSDLHDLTTAGLLVLLAYLAFLDFQVQYVLWVAPFLTLDNLSSRKSILLSTPIYGTAFLLGFFSTNGYSTDSGLSLLFAQSATIQMAIFANQFIDLVLRPVLRTFLTGLMIVFIIVALRKRAELSR